MKSRHACLGSFALVLGFLLLPVAARAQDDITLPRPHDTRRDPFRNPMTPKEADQPLPPKPPKLPDEPAVEPAAKDPAPGDLRDATLREFAAKRLRVTGVVREMVPETIRIPTGVDLLGATIGGEVEVRSWRLCATAVVESPNRTRVVSVGESFDDGLTVRRIERDAVVFLYREVEVRVPLE